MRRVICHIEYADSGTGWDSRFNRTVPTPPFSISNKELYNLIVSQLARHETKGTPGVCVQVTAPQNVGTSGRPLEAHKAVGSKLPQSTTASTKDLPVVVLSGLWIHLCWSVTIADGVGPHPLNDRCSWSARAECSAPLVLIMHVLEELACKCFCKAGRVARYSTIAKMTGSSERPSLPSRLDLMSGMVWLSRGTPRPLSITSAWK